MTDITKVTLQGAQSDTPGALPTGWIPVKVDGNGVLYTQLISGAVALTAIDLSVDDEAIPFALPVAAANVGFNGAGWDRQRAANVFKSVAATAAGDTAVWTPTAGKKFRLLAWRLSVAGTLAAAGTQVIQLRDNATVIARAGANVAQTLPAGDSQLGEDYGMTGHLSAVVNNVLNINLGTAMATGAVYIDAWGTEE